MDTDIKKIIKPFISKSHPIVKSFIASGDLQTSVEEIMVNYNLNEEEKTGVVDLVTEILIGLRDPAELFDQLSEITDLPPSLSEDLGVAIQDIILNTIASKITTNNQPISRAQGVGQSFEQIILNQARAMQPARPKVEAGGDMYHVSSIMDKKEEVPKNLPTEEANLNQNKPQISVPNYGGNSDPYREPLG